VRKRSAAVAREALEMNALLVDAATVLSANRPRLREQSTACHRASP